jgi:hypothetical protein
MIKPPKSNYKAFLVQELNGAIYFTQRKPLADSRRVYMPVDLILLRNELHSFISGVKKQIKEQEFTKVFKASWRKER